MPKVPPVLAAREIAEMFGVTRQRVSQLAMSSGFPEPMAVLGVGRIWLREDVVAWAERTGRIARQDD